MVGPPMGSRVACIDSNVARYPLRFEGHRPKITNLLFKFEDHRTPLEDHGMG
jgi:hypothetical protein